MHGVHRGSIVDLPSPWCFELCGCTSLSPIQMISVLIFGFLWWSSQKWYSTVLWLHRQWNHLLRFWSALQKLVLQSKTMFFLFSKINQDEFSSLIGELEGKVIFTATCNWKNGTTFHLQMASKTLKIQHLNSNYFVLFPDFFLLWTILYFLIGHNIWMYIV